MTDAGQSTTRLHDGQSKKPNGQQARMSLQVLGMKLVRPITYITVGVLILFAGWGAWSYFGSRPKVDESDSIAELDGIEFPAPSIESSKTSKPGSSVPVRTVSDRSKSIVTKDQVSESGHGRTPAVWLTGTIEEIDRTDSVLSPRRISGGPNESTNRR